MTVPTTSGQAFAAANAAMVRGDDSASTVHVLLADCVQILGADGAGVLLQVEHRGLELLAASSHAATDLELFQSQVRHGPCVEAIENGASIAVSGDDAIEERWPDLSAAIAAAGYRAVHAEPLWWHRRVLGAVNLFWSGERVLDPAEREVARAFADICSLALMQSPITDDPAVVGERVRNALRGRVAIERAKGVLAQTEDLDMGQAFARLASMSRDAGRVHAHPPM